MTNPKIIELYGPYPLQDGGWGVRHIIGNEFTEYRCTDPLAALKVLDELTELASSSLSALQNLSEATSSGTGT